MSMAPTGSEHQASVPCFKTYSDGRRYRNPVVIRVIGPSGMETWIRRGKEVGSLEQATAFNSPAEAKKAREAYFNKLNATCFVVPIMIIEYLNDPERSIE